MAGAGVRVFLPGEVLTATLVNTYLQDQVVAIFDTPTARNAAFGDIGNTDNMPELVEGRVCYIRSTNDIMYYSGTAWVSITAGSLVNTITAKGDLLAGTTAGAVDRLAVGTNDYILVADSTQPTGIKWGQIQLSAIADGLITNAKINSSAAIVDTKLGTISTADKVSISALNIDGATDIGSGLADADLIVVDDGGAGTNRKAAVTRVSDYVFSKVSGDLTIASNGAATIAANSVALGTDTTGNYMVDVSAGTGIVVTHSASEGSTATVALADSTLVSNAGSYSLTVSDKNKVIEITGSSSASVTVPTNSSQAFPVGSQVTIIRNGTGTVRIIGSGVTLRHTPGEYLRAQYSSATLIKRATDEWYLIGDLSS